MDRPWGMINVSIFSFTIFGDFNELLVNSVLLAAYIDVASKKRVLTDSNFFLLKIIILYKYTWFMNFFSQ